MPLKEKVEEFLHRKEVLKELRRRTSAGHKSIAVEFGDILEFDKDLAKVLLDSPTVLFDDADAILEGITKILGMHLRVKGLPESVEVRNIRAEHVGQFIQVEGILTRASQVKPEAKEAVFKCRRCGEENRVLQVGEFFREPLACENPNCRRKGPFDLVVESTIFRDWQSLRIQDPPERLRGGRMPQGLDAIARDDLVGAVVPGNHAILTGVLNILQTKRGDAKLTVFRQLLDINAIEILQKGVEETELTPEDEAKIKELAKDPWLRQKIIRSIAPSVYGHEGIKEGVALQLFGSDPIEVKGTRKRGDIHILLTGDPSTAKSVILKWVANVAPRGIYISASKASGPGLTCAAVKDELTGTWALESGALVIADGGLAALDEFEHARPEDENALLESLEQQTVSIAKAGIVATLNTRTSVLAAANPKYGRWEPNLNLSEQIEIDNVMLSRFDLIFLVRDLPHPETDKAIADYVLEPHQRKRLPKSPIEMEDLRKLIIYAHRNFNPVLSEEAAKGIKEFFVEWRKTVARGNPLPITVRQLDGLVRLAKANARMRLSDRVTVEDANRAINLLRVSLREIGVDVETGKPDIDAWLTGQPQSQREKAICVLKIIEELEAEHGGSAPVEEIERLAESKGIRRGFVGEFIKEEKRNGHLYEPQLGTVSRTIK